MSGVYGYSKKINDFRKANHSNYKRQAIVSRFVDTSLQCFYELVIERKKTEYWVKCCLDRRQIEISQERPKA